jgi:peptidoglycan/xylan/chitin deacetylase (PgdA/CDA1 family)
LLLQSRDDLARLLTSQAAEIEQLSGQRVCPLFRPHAGWRGGELYAGLDRAGYTLAGWSFGMWDWNWWRPARADRLAERLARRASDGDIIVMHDGHHINPRADRRRTVQTTAQLVPMLKSRGFRFGNLCADVGR